MLAVRVNCTNHIDIKTLLLSKSTVVLIIPRCLTMLFFCLDEMPEGIFYLWPEVLLQPHWASCVGSLLAGWEECLILAGAESDRPWAFDEVRLRFQWLELGLWACWKEDREPVRCSCDLWWKQHDSLPATYLALVWLFLATASLTLMGSGSLAGMDIFYISKRRREDINRTLWKVSSTLMQLCCSSVCNFTAHLDSTAGSDINWFCGKEVKHYFINTLENYSISGMGASSQKKPFLSI